MKEIRKIKGKDYILYEEYGTIIDLNKDLNMLLNKGVDVITISRGKYKSGGALFTYTNKKKYDIYYRVFDGQTEQYFHIGYNATSMKQLLKAFQSYVNNNEHYPIRHINSWNKIADILQNVTLEKSNTKFESL